MARALWAVAVLGSLFLAPGRAFAQAPASGAKTAVGAFGVAHPFVLSLEHLAGVSYQRIGFDGGDTRTSIQAGVFTPFVSPATPESRLGVHYFVARGVSLGALLDYVDNDSYGTSVLLGARVGAAFTLARGVAVWARAGIAYTHTSQTLSLSSATVSNVLPGVEVLAVLRPLDNFGIVVGPMFEIGVAGIQTTDRTLPTSGASQREQSRFSYFEAALTVGVLADF